MGFPMRRVWCCISTRVKVRKNGDGLLKLHNNVQTCEYQDMQIMWEMLKKAQFESLPCQELHLLPKIIDYYMAVAAINSTDFTVEISRTNKAGAAAQPKTEDNELKSQII